MKISLHTVTILASSNREKGIWLDTGTGGVNELTTPT
jgi:hypothetical protein